VHTCAIVNPAAGGGRVRRVWPRLLSRLLEATASLTVRWTTGPGTATALTRQALHDGAERILAVGGDGTLHEVVNGFFADHAPIAPSALLVFIACGSGSDFRKALGAPTGVDAVQQLRSDRIRPLDLLRVQYTTEDDGREECYAVNIASAGLSGRVVRHFSPGLSPMPPRLGYLGAALRALATDRAAPLRLTLDGKSLPTSRARLVAVANGHSFAAGLPIAPEATPHDGLLDVTVIHDVSVPYLLRHAHRFYLGSHTTLDGVSTHRGHHLTVEPLDDRRPVRTEADGEALGKLPTTIEIIPQTLRIQH
jgi:YegS/Rv2252/BmrU family lipid kinase